MFSTRLAQKPSSFPTLLPARTSFGYQDYILVQYSGSSLSVWNKVACKILPLVGRSKCISNALKHKVLGDMRKSSNISVCKSEQNRPLRRHMDV
jgi:hypothetical protein